MENHSYSKIIGSSQAAYINTVAKECGSATNYHNITHPSLPNYIAATSGLPLSSLPGFLPDCSPAAGCNTAAKSIFGQVKTWKSYEENMPSNCAMTNAGNYAVRHNPATYFTALHNCSSNDVPYARLATDLPRSDCNIDRFLPYTWMTEEADSSNAEHWFGIWNRDGSPRPSGQAYLGAVQLMRSAAARGGTLPICSTVVETTRHRQP